MSCGDGQTIDEEDIEERSIPTIRLTPSSELVCEDNGVLTFALTSDRISSTATTLAFVLRGSATYEEDYVLEASSFIQEGQMLVQDGVEIRSWLGTILPMESTLEVSLKMNEDDESDDDETLILRLDSVNGTALTGDLALSSTATLKEYGDWDGDSFMDLCSPAQIDRMRDAPMGRYELAADIDFSDQGTFAPIARFNGRLEGNGYSLLNISLGKAAAIIGEVSGFIAVFGDENSQAEVRNVGIVGVRADHRDRSGTPVGALVGQVYGGDH